MDEYWEIAYSIYSTAVSIGGIAAGIYSGAVVLSAKVQDSQHNFRGSISYDNQEILFSGTGTYKRWIRLFDGDAEGNAKVKFSGDEPIQVEYPDLSVNGCLMAE